MHRFIISILLFLFFAFNSYSEILKSEEAQYQKISKTNYSISEINKLLIKYKDSLTLPNISKVKSAYYNIVISKLYYKLGAYNKSIDYSKVSLQKFKELKDTSFILYSLINIGAIYGEIDENNIALDYFLEFEKLAKSSNDSDALSYNYINIGNIYSENNTKKALEYYDKALKLRRKADKSNYFVFFILTSKATAYFKQKKYNKALRIYLKAIKLIDDKHFFYNSLCSNIAETYKLVGKIDSSLYFAYKSINNNTKFPSINNLANTYSIITDDYLYIGKTDSAKKYFNLFKDYNDSIIINKKLEYISKLKVLNETDKLIEKNKIQKLKIIQYNTRYKFLLILTIIILITLVIVIFFYKKTQTSYKKIVKESVKSIKIEEEVEELKQQLSIKKNPQNFNSNIENSDKIFYEIIKLLEEDKLYTDHTFTLNKLSEILETNRTYISNIINNKTNDSFIKLVNSYRVKEAKKMLIDEQYKNYTLEAIGKASGFKSTSSFYRVFKNETGVTPSFYIKNKNI